MLSLLLGRSRPGCGQAAEVKVFSASLVRIVRDDTLRLVAAPRQDALQAWTYHWTCCHGETITDWPCCGHVFAEQDTAARCKGTGIGSIVAGRPSCQRFWVADRSDSWSVLAFGAKWIISGRQRVRCGRPACITNAYLWHNLQRVHRLEDYRGTRIINLGVRHNRASTNILVHRLDGIHTHTLTMARLTWEQTAGGMVRTARSTRGNTRARGRGRTGRSDGSPACLTPGSAHCTGKPRGSREVGLRAD